jgi:alanyl-tRNA synthetase
MNREALYYARPGLERLGARLVAFVGEGGAKGLVLDDTIFYPEGGGQPCDLGTMEGLPLLSVTEEGGQVVHRLAVPLPGDWEPGRMLELRLDGPRRLEHSAQHLLSATLLRLFGSPTTSFHLGPERCTIDIDCPALPAEDAAEAERAVNEAIGADYRIITHLCPPEDLADFPLRRRPPSGEAVLRVVEIDGLDFTPCCGTHVASTSALRLLIILGYEKYKGMTRVHFVAGGRAVALARSSAQVARDAARILGCPPQSVAVEVERQAGRLKEALAANKGLVRARATMEADISVAKNPGTGPIILEFRDRDAEAAVEAAKALAERGRVALVASHPDLTACAAAPGPEAGLGARLKPLSEEKGGKGGGGPAFFRASFPNSVYFGDFLGLARRNLQN